MDASRETEAASSSDENTAGTNLPGMQELRDALAKYGRRLIPSRATIRKDGLAGLTVAIASMPGAMAGGLLAGVNPVYGLYANMAGPIVGGLFMSTQLLVINNTSAVSVVAGESISGASADGREPALFLTVVIAGAIAAIFGLLRLGRLMRFVSYSVMTGFIAGIAAVVILSQLSTVAGYETEGDNRITQTIDLFRKVQQIDVPSLLIGLATLAIALGLERTPLKSYASLTAVIAPSIAVALFGLQGVELVRDIGAIPRGVPMPEVPSFTQTLDVLPGALAVAIVVLVQGAGVAQSVPNPDGSRRKTSQDFLAQGLANIASGFFRGLPVGGSLSGTVINVVAGGTRRWACIFSGVWLVVVMIAVPGLVSQVAVPALGALLIYVGIRSIKPADIKAVWRAGWTARIAAATTFAGMLLLPIQYAVGLGVAVSMLLHVGEASSAVRLVQIVELPDGQLAERQPPDNLPGGEVTVLHVYGQLFFAGARTLERALPRPDDGARRPVVVLRLRGHTHLGATAVEVLSRYAERLREVDGRLYLAGVSAEVHRQLERSNKLHLTGPVESYEATAVLGESTRAARADADAWLVEHGRGAPDAAPQAPTTPQAEGNQPE
jgi:SulP family sulfate permease